MREKLQEMTKTAIAGGVAGGLAAPTLTAIGLGAIVSVVVIGISNSVAGD